MDNRSAGTQRKTGNPVMMLFFISASRLVPAVIATILALSIHPVATLAQREHVGLNGDWDFKLDPREQGVAFGWPAAGVPFDRTIAVPGAWQAQGAGEPNGMLRHDYTGAAWYRRKVSIPSTWRGKVITLRIGGAHLETALFVNGQQIGEHSGFSAPFSFDVSKALIPGKENVIALRIANPGAVPLESPDKQLPARPTGMLNYIGNWGGIYGNVELRATNAIFIEHVYVKSDIERKTASFIVTVKNQRTGTFTGELDVKVSSDTKQQMSLKLAAGERAEVKMTVPIKNMQLWSPDQPNLYTATVGLLEKGREIDRTQERFGMRELVTRGNVLLLNGKPLYLRGYGDDNIEVLTGFPPGSRETYLQRLRRARDFGFNTVRFHSMTPSEDFFQAADEVGLLVMAELPAAYTQYVLPHRAFLRNELRDILMAYRNHPSLLSLAFGNEFNLNWLKTEAERKDFLKVVDSFYRFAKSLHPDGLILSNDGFFMQPTDMVSRYGNGIPSHPSIKHEFGDYYCSLPDISLIDKFTGVVLPGWLHAKKNWVADQGLTNRYTEYVRNSQRLQQMGRKYQIERVRHRQDFMGYHYWLIVDFPGGTGEGDSWEEGWFDYFWNPKNISPQQGQMLNNAVIPLLTTTIDNYTFWNDSVRQVEVSLSNYGDKNLQDVTLSWKVVSNSKTLASGTTKVSQPMGIVGPVTRITLPPMPSPEARKVELIVEVDGAHSNRWSFWTFPRSKLLQRPKLPLYADTIWPGMKRQYSFVQEKTTPAGGGLLVTSRLDENALQHLDAGGRVWLMAEPPKNAKNGAVSFLPAQGGALGTVILNHPSLEGFPHEGFADWQLYTLMDGATPFSLDKWPATLTPIIGGIRTKAGFLSKSKDLSRVGYAFEAKVGRGSLLVTSLRFRDHLDNEHPEAIHLFDRFLQYASGSSFAPKVEVGSDLLQGLNIQ
ncbi:MAG TPA: beta galactosidase jelly roll domain-containing protein [Flavitalea sp.]|nr:beta galactosidase jelly roll domain-containing protein [Flavitalea sp.]